MTQLLSYWQDHLVKYTYTKETGSILINYGNKTIPFGFDETPHFDLINYHWNVDANVGSITKSYAQVLQPQNLQV